MKASKVPITITIDPALKREYKRLVGVIAKAARSEKKDFDALWEAAGRIVEHEPPLYFAGNFATADEFYRGALHEEPRNAQRYIRVAKYATPDEEVRFGISKLESAIAFIEAKLGAIPAHPPLPVAFDRVRIPVKRGSKSLEDASVAEVRAATVALTGKAKRTKSAAHHVLEKALAAVSSLKDIDVKERDGFVSFQRIPLAALDRFLKALNMARADLP